ncbi:MAG TPA: hypothetical protein VFE10_18165 [Phenylobacterium sp.]|nr:hypothetical protein [Phenylobacterium sp.]
MFWRIYAVAYLVFAVSILPPTLGRLPHLSPIDILDMLVFTPIAVVGLWSAAYRHLSLPINTWKMLLFISVFWRALFVGNIILFNDLVGKVHSGLVFLNGRMAPAAANGVMVAGLAVGFLVGSFLVVPPLIALYRNAYGDESLLKLMSPMRARQAA